MDRKTQKVTWLTCLVATDLTMLRSLLFFHSFQTS